MSVTGTLKKGADAVVDKIAASSRHGIIARLELLREQHETAVREREKAISEAQAVVDRLMEPHRRLERLKEEAAVAASAEARELACVESELRAAAPRGLSRYLALLDRLFDAIRAERPPSPEHITDAITGTVVSTTNLVAIQRHLALGGLLLGQRGEIHDHVWKLPTDALTARLAELRAELAAGCEGTCLESLLE
jgi:hypothetical protein